MTAQDPPAGPGRPGQPGALGLALGFTVVFVLCVTAVHFAPVGSAVAAWWPAAGVGTGLLALSSPRRWPAILLATVAVTGAANLAGGRELSVSALFGVVNATEGLVVALVLGAHHRRPWLRTRQEFARLIAAATAGAVVVGSLAGLVVGGVLDGDLSSTMTTVAASHGAAQLLVVPVLLLLTDPQAGARTRILGPALVFQIVSALAVTFFAHRVGSALPLAFLPLPFLVWGALVLSIRALAVEALAVGTMVTFLTARGGGPFANLDNLSASASAALVQVDLVVIALVSLPLALAMGERSAALTEAVAGREESRLAQLQLAREQEFTASLLDATIGTSIIATDETGRITYANRGAEILLGYRSTALIGRSVTSLHLQDELDLRMTESGADSPVEAVVGAGRRGVDGRDWTYLGADERQVRVSVRVSPLLDSTGALVGHLAVAEDITDRVEAQESLRRLLDIERAAVERLSDLDRAKSEFLATVSHELRTPMTNVLGFNQILRGERVGPLNDRQRDLLRRVDRSGQRLLALIENILALSRIETSESTADRIHLFVDGLIGSAIDATETLRWNRDLAVTTEPGPPGPSLTVFGDPEQLERALVNLLSNALKFTPDGGSVEVEARRETGEAVSIIVTDTGIGIPDAEQTHLFDRFFRASNAVSDSIQGTGLGLTIVRTIVEAHDGALGIASRIGHGTSVTMTLPVHPPAGYGTSAATASINSSASNGLTT